MPSRKIKTIDTSGLLGACPLLQDIDPAAIAAVAGRVRDRALVRGEALFNRGDVPHGLFLVVYGQIKLSFPGANGNEQVVQLAGPRQCFGHVAVLTASRHILQAESVTDSLVLQMPKDLVLEMLDRHPAFARRMLTELAQRTQALLQDVETYTQLSSAERVISFLRQHCPVEPHREDSIEITLPATKSLIASRLNLTPETLSRILHELSAADLIAVQGKQIQIKSPKRLHEYNA